MGRPAQVTVDPRIANAAESLLALIAENLHDAVLIKPYPKGVTVKGFRSGPPPGTTNLNWTVRFTKPGAYIFNCTNHSTEMRATIRVRR